MNNTAQNYGIDFKKLTESDEHYRQNWTHAMNIARLEIDNSQLKREFINWATSANIEDIQHFAALPDWHYVTIGKIAWLVNNGAAMSEQSKKFMESKISVLKNVQIENSESEDVVTTDAKRVIQYVNLYSKIDVLRMKYINDTQTLEDEVRKLFSGNHVAMNMIKKLYNHFKESLDDALADIDNTEVTTWVDPLVTVVNVLAACTGNAQAINAMSKKIKGNAVKAAKKANVKRVDQDTNIVGLNPAMIVGNTHALVYNCKTRKVMIYSTRPGEKLGVKGTYITGFDQALSFGKTLRKPKETFSKMLHNATVDRIRHILNENVSGKRHEINGKLNSETLLVKVFK